MTIQTNTQIKELLDSGEIVMRPRRDDQINNGSIDVTLGRFVARVRPEFRADYAGLTAELHANILDPSNYFVLEDLGPRGQLYLQPGERVLAHTHEFIGGRSTILPEMRARSSTGRWGFTVALCAGFGDCNYINRWAMEVMNLNGCPALLSVGTRIAQVVFNEVKEPASGTLYGQPGAGQYQDGIDLEHIIKTWHPRSLLPRPLKVVPFQVVTAVDETGLA